MNVLDLLVKHNIYFKDSGGDALVTCLNPEHPDRNPSMRVDRITGIFNCFSCGFKGNIFSFFGEKANFLDSKRELLRRKILEKQSDSVGLSFPLNSVPYEGTWRGISKETYTLFEAFESSNEDFIGRVNFPIRNLSGKITGFIGRHTTGGDPKYLVSPPKAKFPLYPKVTHIRGSVLLVEGIYDMLNLHDKGLTNAVCCFGVNKVTSDKLSILSIEGVTCIDIFFDGDEAGSAGAEKVSALCEEAGLSHRNISIAGKDPGSLSQEQVDRLFKKLYS